MNNKIFLLFILNFISSVVSAQNCNYAEYNEHIELARKEFNQENFKEANKLYKVAFEKTDFPFGRDLQVALKVAKKTRDKIWMEQVAVRLAKGGIPLKFFRPFEDFKWYEGFREKFPEYQQYFNDNFDLEFRNNLFKISKLDKETNEHFHEWRTRKEEHSIDTLVAEMYIVSTAFQEMVNKFGFPSEKKIGYYYNKVEVDILPTSVLIRHIYQRGESIYLEQLKELACNGNLYFYDYEELQKVHKFLKTKSIEQTMEDFKKKHQKNN
jgi:hypothetical protein